MEGDCGNHHSLLRRPRLGMDGVEASWLQIVAGDDLMLMWRVFEKEGRVRRHVAGRYELSTRDENLLRSP
jgi:hypothetical protein